MRKISVILFGFLLCSAVRGQEFSMKTHTEAVGDVVLACGDPGGWKFSTSLERSGGKEYLTIGLSSEEEAVPPCFEIRFSIPQKDIFHLWEVNGTARFGIPPDWSGATQTHLALGMPLYTFLGENDRNRLTVACNEVFRTVEALMGLREESCLIVGRMKFFTEPEAPVSSYRTTVCFDARDTFWAESVRESALWMGKSAGCEPCPVPDAAYEPLYSSWYQFHQDVHASDIEEESALASALGMKTIIVDDGWQTDDNNRGYAFCGDWRVSENRFPDFAAHVSRVQDLGMKYMLWYSVPFVGSKSANYGRFQDKFLRYEPSLDTGVLDPRFPEVREFLIQTYVRAAREWGLDGFKLDFIDAFRVWGEDPAVAQDYAGRDIKTVPEAVNVLMKGIRDALFAIRPDMLIEFRQAYVGPAISQYGNMFRVGDCPGQSQQNRIGICNLRLAAPTVAVHSDMIEWNLGESPENAARNIISALFGVVQYSVMLREIPPEHRDVIAHWLAFSREHRDACLHGWFRPSHPEAGYPLVSAGNGTETISVVYQDNTVVPVKLDGKSVFIINAGCSGDVYLDMDGKVRSCSVFDMYGHPVPSRKPGTGAVRVQIPVGGYMLVK